MLCKDGGVIVTDRVQEPRRPFHVSEEKREGAARRVRHERSLTSATETAKRIATDLRFAGRGRRYPRFHDEGHSPRDAASIPTDARIGREPRRASNLSDARDSWLGRSVRNATEPVHCRPFIRGILRCALDPSGAGGALTPCADRQPTQQPPPAETPTAH